jgi:hypothetical protein
LAATLAVVAILTAQAWFKHASPIYNVSGSGYVAEDPVIGYVGMPNAEMHHLVPPLYSAFTDDRGGREDRLGRNAPANIDALFIGDSYTWGDGVQVEDTFPKLLGQRLGLTVFNAAVPSYGVVNALLSIDKFIDLKPRYIVFGFLNDQLRRNYSPCADSGVFLCRPTAYLDGDADHLEIRLPLDHGHTHVRYLREIEFSHIFGWRDVYWAAYRDVYMTLANTRRPSNSPPGDFWPTRGDASRYFERAFDPKWRERGLRFLVERMASKAESIDAQLIFVYIPSDRLVSPPGPEVDEAIRPLIRDGRLTFLDMTPALREGARSSEMFFLSNNHPTPAANQIIADNIAAAIAKSRR